MSYVLMVVLLVGGTPRPVAFTQEFNSFKTCQAAAAMVRNSSPRVELLVCTEK